MPALFRGSWVPRWLTPGHPLVLSIYTVTGLVLTFALHRDYRGWLSLGPAGLPHNAFGYLMQILLRPLGIRDRTDTRPFRSERVGKEVPGRFAHREYLAKEDVLVRGRVEVEVDDKQGSRNGQTREETEKKDKKDANKGRPEVCSWIVPQRQMNERAGEDMKKLIQAHIVSLAAEQPEDLHVATSVFERHGAAIFATNPTHGSVNAKAYGEIAHMHVVDGSVHVTLTPLDAALVIDRGWGERMGLAGRGFKIPSTLVFVYAPRNEAELETVKKIVDAGVAFGLADE